MTIIIPPLGSHSLKVRFKPTAAGVRSGSISFQSNTPESPHVISLRGTGRVVDENENEPTYLSAVGSELRLNKGAGDEIILKGFNWYGFEGQLMPNVLWVRAYRTVTDIGGETHLGVLDQMAAQGFNCVRLPLCQDVTWPGRRITTGNSISANRNPDFLVDPTLTGSATGSQVKPAIECLDLIIDHCERLGIRVILDMHCLAPNTDNALGTMGKWYTTETPDAPGATQGTTGEPRNEEQWIAAWEFLANRYKDRPIVCGFDLINEPYNCTWNDDPLTGLPAALERCAARVHAINPDVLIVCEGLAGNITYPNGEIWGSPWGGNFTGVRARPVSIVRQDKVVYSPHDYANYGAGAGPAWIHDPRFPEILHYAWDTAWGFIAKEGIAPLVVGEFGGNYNPGETVGPQWQEKINEYYTYLKISWIYWALPGNSGNQLQGILAENHIDLQSFTMAALQPLLTFDPGGGGANPFALLDSAGEYLLDNNNLAIES